uniref:Uncharacterized protein n=2 Tax=Caenorhabditis japonica TaxID=281687 RepID=A0A8R1I7J1_CAEJA
MGLPLFKMEASPRGMSARTMAQLNECGRNPFNERETHMYVAGADQMKNTKSTPLLAIVWLRHREPNAFFKTGLLMTTVIPRMLKIKPKNATWNTVKTVLEGPQNNLPKNRIALLN